MAQGSEDAHGVPTLDELISERKRLRGFSYADLENRAESTISRQRWQQLGTGVRVKEFPEPATLEAMAVALDVDVAEVVLAAARSIGLDVKRGAQSDLAARLPSTADRLSEVQRDAIVTLVRSITEDRHADQPQPAPTHPSAEESGGQGTQDKKNRAADGRDHDGGTDPEGRAADDARPNVWREEPDENRAADLIGADQASGIDANTTQSDYDLAHRRGGGESETRRIKREQDEAAERGDA